MPIVPVVLSSINWKKQNKNNVLLFLLSLQLLMLLLVVPSSAVDGGSTTTTDDETTIIPSHKKKIHVAVLGGMMKSHHISVVPIIEGLLENGHDVSFLMPNTTECKNYFPQGIGAANMVYLGTKDWSFDTLFSGPEYDLKNMPWYKKPSTIFKILWNYRSEVDAPMFSMHEELVEWIETNKRKQKAEDDDDETTAPKIDVILFHIASFGSKPVVASSGVPTVGYFSLPPLPILLEMDKDKQCAYPNNMSPPPLDLLKSSMVERIKNQLVWRFMQGYNVIVSHEINALFQARGIPYTFDLMNLFSDFSQVMLLGGPPLSLNVKLAQNMHVLGIIENSPKEDPSMTTNAIPADMFAWLNGDDASYSSSSSSPVVYISMGTKYEIQEAICEKLLASMERLMQQANARFLWSLRASQQEKLEPLLLPYKTNPKVKIVEFTPQGDVLQHPSVKIFLSHCGWGGVTDTITAGVPVLAYPGMSEQFLNAQMLESIGAGIILNPDLSNLVESAETMLQPTRYPNYASASRQAGETLRSYGGLPRAIEVIEGVAELANLDDDNDSSSLEAKIQPDPDMFAKANDIDPFFEVPQPVEKWIALWIYFVFLVVVPLVIVCGSLYFCCCGGGRRRSSRKAMVENNKKKTN